MFIAHLPAGYLFTRALLRAHKGPMPQPGWVLALGLLGSIAPDLDLLYHYNSATPVFHHYYWTHYPLVWALPMLAAIVLALCLRRPSLAFASLVLGSNALLHHVLDTVWGRIGWFWPWDKTLYRWVTVPRHTSRFWVWDYALHWTAALELAIVCTALALACWRWRKGLRA